MKSRQWMYELCGYTERINRPFAQRYLDTDWDVATNGMAMLLMRGATFEPKISAPNVSQVLSKIGSPRSVRTVPVDALKDFASCATGRAEVQRVGLIGGIHIDRSLLWKFIRQMEGTDCEILIPENWHVVDPICFRGDDWLVAMMPVRPRFGEGDLVEFFS